MNLITQSDLARRAGVERQAVQNALKRNRLRKYGQTAKIDLDDVLTKIYLKSENRSRQPKPVKKTAKPRGKTGSKKSESNGKNNSPSHSLDETINDERLKKVEIDTEKSRQQMLKFKIDHEVARGKLIDRGLVKQIFGQIYTVDTNEFRTLGDRLAPEIAALAGVDDSGVTMEINRYIEKEVLKSLKHVRRLIDDFLKSIKKSDE